MNLLHALFTRNLLMSGVAIVRYIPPAFRVKQVDGNLSAALLALYQGMDAPGTRSAKSTHA